MSRFLSSRSFEKSSVKSQIPNVKTSTVKSDEKSYGDAKSGRGDIGKKLEKVVGDPGDGRDGDDESKFDFYQSDDFERMLVNQGILSVSDYHTSIKLLEPSEQEFDKILEETCEEFKNLKSKTSSAFKSSPRDKMIADKTVRRDESSLGKKIKTPISILGKTESVIKRLPETIPPSYTNTIKQSKALPRSDASSNVVILNKRKQKLTPAEIKKMEEILLLHRIDGDGDDGVKDRKKPIRTSRSEPEKTSQVIFTKTNIDRRVPDFNPTSGFAPQKVSKTSYVDDVGKNFRVTQSKPPTDDVIEYTHYKKKTVTVVTTSKTGNTESQTGNNDKLDSLIFLLSKKGNENSYRDAIIHSPVCDSYCNYYKKENDSGFENNFQYGGKSYGKPKDRIFYSSVDDFIRKLNQSDVDTWLMENGGASFKTRRHSSKSLGNLKSEFMTSPPQFVVPAADDDDDELSKSKRQTNAVHFRSDSKSEALSKSVLDLRKVGLPKNSKGSIFEISEEGGDSEDIENPRIVLSIRDIDPTKAQIQISNWSGGNGWEKKLPAIKSHVFDRRCSEVFGQRADASPYLNDTTSAALSKPMTLSLQSLNSDRKRKTPREKYEKLQSMECLIENRDVGRADTERRRFPTDSSDVGKNTKMDNSLFINRIYVHTPYEKEFRDLTKPKKPKSILKKTSSYNFKPLFESISLTSLPQDDHYKSSMKFSKGGGSAVMKTPRGGKKSQSCGNILSNLKSSYCVSKDAENRRRLLFYDSHNNNNNNRSSPSSSMSLSDSQFDSSDSSWRMMPPKMNLISRYTKPTAEFSRIRGASENDDDDDEFNLSEIDCLNVQSDDSEFADKGFGYFYREK